MLPPYPLPLTNLLANLRTCLLTLGHRHRPLVALTRQRRQLGTRGARAAPARARRERRRGGSRVPAQPLPAGALVRGPLQARQGQGQGEQAGEQGGEQRRRQVGQRPAA